jgi:hypothetical protein
MRRIASLLAVLGVVALAGAAAVGLIGVDTKVAGRTYDCGAPVGRLGGDDRETEWRKYSFLVSADPRTADTPPQDLPQTACKEKTNDRLKIMYVLLGLGVVLLLAALVLFLVGRRRRPAAPAPPPPPAEVA